MRSLKTVVLVEFAGLLLCGVGCVTTPPAKAPVQSAQPAPAVQTAPAAKSPEPIVPASATAPAAGTTTSTTVVISKADLETLRYQYMKRLRLIHTFRVTESQNERVLKLFNFLADRGPAHEYFHEFNDAVKRLIVSKNGKVTEWREVAEELNCQYDCGYVHGVASCQLKGRRDSELPFWHWDINLTVKEELRR